MTPEEEIKKMREENQSLRDALSNMMPNASSIAEKMKEMEAKTKELEQVKKAMEGFPAQLAPLTAFLSSPEAKKAMEKFASKTDAPKKK